MVYLLFGKANFLIKEEQERIVADFAVKNSQANIEKFDAEEDWSFSAVKESLSQGGGLFSSKKLILIRNIDKASKQDQEGLIELIKLSIPEESDNLVIFTAEKPVKKDKIFRLLFSKAKTVEFKELQGDALRRWIVKKVSNLSDGKMKIEGGAVSQLELMYGKDLWQLGNALMSLVNFTSEKNEISKVDVNEICRGKVDVKIFDFVDAIGARNKSRAIELLNSLLSQGENGFYILSMILFQLRNLVKVFSISKKGPTNPTIISKKLSIHPFVAQKTLGQLNNFSSDSLKKVYQQIADIDYQAKMGEKSIEDGLTDFIVRL
ncbi:MAG: DNA polymerase III subunit delta [Patescibacteria group bacterium]|nr:DNA polymerase III subunit delta [Patescibacteria group bacterium]